MQDILSYDYAFHMLENHHLEFSKSFFRKSLLDARSYLLSESHGDFVDKLSKLLLLVPTTAKTSLFSYYAFNNFIRILNRLCIGLIVDFI